MSDDTKLSFSLDGEKLEGRAGDTLAAALLRAGATTFTRSIKYHRPRGPFCFAGSCGQCLVRVDGVPSLPACRVPLEAGMACERQNGPLGSVESDLFRAVDFLYPGGLDHHHLMIQSRLLGRVALEVARRLAGLGTLPAKALPAQAGGAREVPLVIVGAGPAGLSAARGALGANAAVRPLVLEREAQSGGAARLGLDASLDATELARGVSALGDRIELLHDAEVVGLYGDAQPSGEALLAVRQGAKLLAVRARRVVIATGGHSQPLPFPGNDRPGVHAARGLLSLFDASGVRAGEGKLLVLAGAGRELARCARALVSRGYALAAMVVLDNQFFERPSSVPAEVPLLHGEVIRVRGNPVAELQVRLSNPSDKPGAVRKIRCGAVAIALPLAASHDLASSAGARAALAIDESGFPLSTDEAGRTNLGWLFACGTAAGKPLIDGGAASREAAERTGAQAALEAAAV